MVEGEGRTVVGRQDGRDHRITPRKEAFGCLRGGFVSTIMDRVRRMGAGHDETDVRRASVGVGSLHI